jgi:hypothetical protein
MMNQDFRAPQGAEQATAAKAALALAERSDATTAIDIYSG